MLVQLMSLFMFMLMFMSHTSLNFFVLSFVLARVCARVASNDQALCFRFAQNFKHVFLVFLKALMRIGSLIYESLFMRPGCACAFVEGYVASFQNFLQDSVKGLRPVHMVPLSEIPHQVRQNIDWFHMGVFISFYVMKCAGSELTSNKNTAFHFGNRAGVYLTGEISASEPARFLI